MEGEEENQSSPQNLFRPNSPVFLFQDRGIHSAPTRPVFLFPDLKIHSAPTRQALPPYHSPSNLPMQHPITIHAPTASARVGLIGPDGTHDPKTPRNSLTPSHLPRFILADAPSVETPPRIPYNPAMAPFSSYSISVSPLYILCLPTKTNPRNLGFCCNSRIPAPSASRPTPGNALQTLALQKNSARLGHFSVFCQIDKKRQNHCWTIRQTTKNDNSTPLFCRQIAGTPTPPLPPVVRPSRGTTLRTARHHLASTHTRPAPRRLCLPS